MCGIAGIFDFRAQVPKASKAQTAAMLAKALSHRGPDGSGVWLNEPGNIALVHTRLSIIDLSDAGSQPMKAADETAIISYNGEIYNASELRQELMDLGQSFTGYSDTEVLLSACQVWGVEDTVKRLIGMFAFAYYDLKTNCLKLVRDRLGIKPLYWTVTDEVFLFASELMTVLSHPSIPCNLEKKALHGYLRNGYISGKQSIVEGCQQLKPGTILTRAEDGSVSVQEYWSVDSLANKPSIQHPQDDKMLTDALETLLTDAVSIRMVADVPLGAFLSGGIDSTTVVALMQQVSDTPVNTYSIGFKESDYDESIHAANIAEYLKTDHTQLIVSPQDALDVIPHLASIYDEPFADPSQIPTYLLSKLTRRHVTVALSGDGGDELFAGYSRYYHTMQLEEKIERLPKPLRSMLSTAVGLTPEIALKLIASCLPYRRRSALLGDKLGTLAKLLSSSNRGLLYQSVSSRCDAPENLISGSEKMPRLNLSSTGNTEDFLQYMQHCDLVNYLPDDILTKLDRASMAVGLEARVPLLDHRVVEFANQLPTHMKVRDGETKWLLRQVLYRHVPRAMVDRPKMGFGIPIGQWLRTDLQIWAKEQLFDNDIRQLELLNYNLIDKKWKQHQQKVANWEFQLWDVLMLHGWIKKHFLA